MPMALKLSVNEREALERLGFEMPGWSESPLPRRKERCHIYFSKTINLSHSRLLGVSRLARLCLCDFSFDHLDDAGGRLVGERQPLRFDDESGQGLRLIAESRVACDQVFDDAAFAFGARHALAQAGRDSVFYGHGLVLHHHQQWVEFLFNLFTQPVDLEQRRFESQASAQREFYDRRLSRGFGPGVSPGLSVVWIVRGDFKTKL